MKGRALLASDDSEQRNNNPADDVEGETPQTLAAPGTDERYFELFAKAIRVCANYKPKFGKGGSGLNLDGFRRMYQ